MMCGSGVHLSGAYDEVKELAELLSIPVITNHPAKAASLRIILYVGITGRYGSTLANKVVRDADLVFFVANRAGGHTTANLQVPNRVQRRSSNWT